MIKIPATPQGVPAIRQALEDGINVNITLLFAQSAYEQVAEAYLAALEARAAKGQDISHIASVASFFVSRIDSLVTARLTQCSRPKPTRQRNRCSNRSSAKSLSPTLAAPTPSIRNFSVAPAGRLSRQRAARRNVCSGPAPAPKNPKYRDVLYVEELIGADTVDTIPPATFDAFRDHGKLRPSLTENVEGANRTMNDLAAAGISMKELPTS